MEGEHSHDDRDREWGEITARKKKVKDCQNPLEVGKSQGKKREGKICSGFLRFSRTF